MAVITLLVLLFPRQSSMSADDDKEFGSSMLPWGRLNRGLLTTWRNDFSEASRGGSVLRAFERDLVHKVKVSHVGHNHSFSQ